MQLLVLALLVISTVAATLVPAIDFVQPVTTTQVQCLKDNQISVILVRAYTSMGGGTFDYNYCNTFKLAQSYGIGVQYYMEPSATGGKTGTQQFNDLMNGLALFNCNAARGPVGPIIYLQVTSPLNWNRSADQNKKIIQDIVKASEAKGIAVGIYTDADDWNIITNNANHTEFMSHNHVRPLWLKKDASNDGQGAKNFKPFGGWIAPYIYVTQNSEKQLICGIECNKDTFTTL